LLSYLDKRKGKTKTKREPTNYRKPILMNRNYPLIIVSALGIITSLVLVYMYVYQRAINSVRSAALIEKAYPRIKPEEYINQLRIQAQKNKIPVLQF